MNGSNPDGSARPKGSGGGGVERWYGALLHAYPRPYRQRDGEEMIGVLMALRPGARVPSLRESWSLLRRGTAARLARAGQRSWAVPAGAAGLTLAVLMAVRALQAQVDPVPGLLFLVTWVAVMLDRGRLAAAAAWAAALAYAAVVLPRLGSPGNWGPGYQVPPVDLGGGNFMSSASPAVDEARTIGVWVVALALAVLLTGRHRLAAGTGALGRRTLAWATAAGLAVAVVTEMLTGGPRELAPAAAAAVLLAAMVRGRIALRGSLLVASSLSYLVLAGQADGSGSRIPREGVPLALTLALIPVLAAAAAWLVLTVHESDTDPHAGTAPGPGPSGGTN